MAWSSVAMGIGIVLILGGAITVVAGLAITLAGPDAVDDANGGSDGGGDGLLSLMSNDDAGDDRARERQEVRAAGVAVMAAGAGFVLIGGALFGAGRVVSHREANQQQSQSVHIVTK